MGLFRVIAFVIGIGVAGFLILRRAQDTSPASAASNTVSTEIRASAERAHATYVAAINSNNIDSLMAMMTEDVVFLSPHEPVLVGKAAVRLWGEAYLKAFRIHWQKTSFEFVVAGDWAFERYGYIATDTPAGGGAAITDTGKGLVLYRREPDGVWRVARDAWSSDLPATRPSA